MIGVDKSYFRHFCLLSLHLMLALAILAAKSSFCLPRWLCIWERVSLAETVHNIYN